MAREIPVGVVDPFEAGVVVGRLLGTEDVSEHSGKTYVVNGPEDDTGEGIVKLVEGVMGRKVGDGVVYEIVGFAGGVFWEAYPKESRVLMESFVYSLDKSWHGKCTALTMSREVLGDCAAKADACGGVQVYAGRVRIGT
ncbi:hypothetical protein B0T14DRAFT_590921 [Immersiella caudata]|uniref:Uncharacterized protein n=1 Tax=Immersiella caudata TaxID=314043 RepID=A0AA39WD91_9PEZI|nr:hypothetical protein B0T14DRAFT_590921 [Immersiella caudata]